MTKNLNNINKDVKKILKKYKFKNNSILIGLAALVISCGGGGGNGVGTSLKPTPTPNTPSDSTPAIGWNDSTVSYNKNNPNNKPDTTVTGSGVNIGIIDIAFENPAFASELTEKFGTRLEKLTVPDFTATYVPEEEHGIAVAALAAGSIEGIAKEAKVYVIDAGKKGPDPKDSSKEKTHPEVSLDMYRALKNKGVTIYNQSFGSEALQESDSTTYVRQMGRAVIRFYEEEINNGSLFVWAAGNVSTDKQPTLEAGLPYFNSSLEKGWINVVALTAKTGSESGNRDWNNLKALSPAGVAKNWTVTVLGDQYYKLKTLYYVGSGSSYAAPIVTGTAALIKQKYPWMDGSLIRQTILSTATDIGEKGVDEIYGWGLLNIDKALKGPALFSKQLALSDNVVIDIPSGTYTFSNNISGDAGLIKNGAGELILSGNSTFTGDTRVNAGKVRVNGRYKSALSIGRQAILSTGNALIQNNITNEGILENTGTTQIIGNYQSLGNSKIIADLNSNLYVKGQVSLNNSQLELKPEENGERKYITSNGITQNVITSDNKIEGNFKDVSTDELLNANINQNENSISTKLNRKNVLEYAKETKVDEMQQNTAQNIEAAFQKLDEEIENGKAGNLSSFEKKAATLQALDLTNRAAILDSLSGQIYASAQALTFQHSQTVNKDLSNRLVMLGTLDNVGDNFGLWVSSFGANGKLEQNGYGKGDTKVFGGQVGIDKQFGDNLILGTALSYSKADVKFNRYGGKSDASNFGISLYGRLGNKDIPWYLQGRFGVGFVDSDVERDIILSSNDYSRAKINHNDKVYSGYVETGYDIKNSNGDFVVTPFAGITHDTVTRGSFSEDKSQFGLKADKKNYSQTSALAGVRVGKAVQWNGGSKTTFQGYVTHQRAFNDEDLSFKAEYSGLPGSSFKVKGIGLSKSKTKAGVGALTEVNSSFGWYVNYDGEISSGKGKGNNNVVTTGLRFNF